MITKPQRPAGLVRGQRLIDLLPVFVLALGLAVVAAVVLSEPPITPERLRAFVAAIFEPRPIGQTDPQFSFPPISPFDPTLEHRSWLMTMALFAMYVTSTCAIGSGVAAAIRGDDDWPRPVRWLSAFLPGYLIMLAPLEILFSAFTYTTAGWVTFCATPICALMVQRHAVVEIWGRVRSEPRTLLSCTGMVAVCVAVIAAAAVHRLQQGVFFLTQDSITYFLQAAMIQFGGGYGKYLLHWNTQTDEWLYNAPFMFTPGRPGDLWFPFYMTQSIGVAAFLCLVWGIVHRVARRRKRLVATMAVVATFGFSLSIFPWLYVLIVGGGQPVVALAHPGRLIGIVAPWAAVLMLPRLRQVGVPTLALMTLGVGFLTINAWFYIGLAVIGALVWRALRDRPELLRSTVVRAGVQATVPLAVVLPVVAFAFTVGVPATPAIPALILVVGAGAAVLGALVVCVATTNRGDTARIARRTVGWFFAWCGTAILGLLLGDNLASRSGVLLLHTKILAPLLPGYGTDYTFFRVELPGGAFDGLSFPTFSKDACNSAISCGGVPYFLVAYGVLFALVLAAWAAYGRLRPDSEDNDRRAALLLGLAAMTMGLVLVFFTGATGLQAAVLTRLLESPYYTLLIVAVLAFCESRHRVVVVVGVAFFAIWTIGPLLGVEWPQQFVRNAGWYVRLLT